MGGTLDPPGLLGYHALDSRVVDRFTPTGLDHCPLDRGQGRRYRLAEFPQFLWKTRTLASCP